VTGGVAIQRSPPSPADLIPRLCFVPGLGFSPRRGGRGSWGGSASELARLPSNQNAKQVGQILKVKFKPESVSLVHAFF
jgi:hypothetical protein